VGSIRSITPTEDASMIRRLLKAMPSSRFEMETLTRLAGIKVTREVPTAAVECTRRPRLLVNPDFVKAYCPNDEHLFLLVMHELWHVQLAHTRMFPRMTKLQNIAFDAVINAGLMHAFPDAEYRGFFDAVNPADKFPSCLLRPPEGWPDNPQYPQGIGPEGTTELVRRLYPAGNTSFGPPPMYEDVLRLLLKGGMSWIDESYTLLGNHDSPVHDPLIKDWLKQVSANWSYMPGAPGGAAGTHRRGYGISDTTDEVRRAFARALRVALSNRAGTQSRRTKTTVRSVGGSGVLPNPRDRYAPARQRLGMSSLLWAQPADIKVRQPQIAARSFVYLDVSGSMNEYLPYMLGLLAPYVGNGQAEAYQFSNRVWPISYQELRGGKLTTTIGTSINAVIEHVVSQQPAVDKVVIVTDGEFGWLSEQLKTQVKALGTRFYFILPTGPTVSASVKDLITSETRLPRLR